MASFIIENITVEEAMALARWYKAHHPMAKEHWSKRENKDPVIEDILFYPGTLDSAEKVVCKIF